MPLNKQFYFLSPVEVVKVTSQNLEEVAEWCGGSVQETESRKVSGRMDKYVLVPTPKESSISWAFPGMYITKRMVVTVKDELRTTFAVFRRDYFEKNYFDTPKAATDKTWEREEAEKKNNKRAPEIHVTVNVGDALLQAQKAKQAKLDEAKELMVEAGVSEEEAQEVVQQFDSTGEVPTCYWREPHALEPDDRLPEGCGWRTVHNFQPTQLPVDASL